MNTLDELFKSDKQRKRFFAILKGPKFSLYMKKRNLRAWNLTQAKLFKEVGLSEPGHYIKGGKVFAELSDKIKRFPSVKQFKKQLSV